MSGIGVSIHHKLIDPKSVNNRLATTLGYLQNFNKCLWLYRNAWNWQIKKFFSHKYKKNSANAHALQISSTLWRWPTRNEETEQGCCCYLSFFLCQFFLFVRQLAAVFYVYRASVQPAASASYCGGLQAVYEHRIQGSLQKSIHWTVGGPMEWAVTGLYNAK